MNLLFISDDNYAPYLGVAIASTLQYNIGQNSYPYNKINIYLMDRDISSTNKDKIDSIVTGYGANIQYIETKETHDYLKSLIKSDVKSMSVYYRLFLETLLPTDVKKLIYLDCDSFIKAPLTDLWNINMEDYDIAGVMDVIKNEHKTAIGLQPHDIYLNAGMLLINLSRWRAQSMEQKFTEFINLNNGKVRYHDQGTINAVCKSKMVIHPSFNAMTPFFVLSYKHLCHYHSLKKYYSKVEITEARKNPIFIHFTPHLVDRPWSKGNYHPLRKEYIKFMDDGPWKGTPLLEPSKIIEPWVKKLFYYLPYSLFIISLRFLQWFRIKTWIKKLVGVKEKY